MALLSSLFDNMGQLAPQESPTDELMRRALELNKAAPVMQGITISRPDMPDMVNRALGPQPTVGGWEPTVTQAPTPAPAPAPAPQQPVARPPVQLAQSNAAAAAAVPQRQPSFMDRMAAFASGYQGGGLIGAIANASQGPDKAMETENMTARLLAGRLGVGPQEALALARRPDIMQQLLPVLTGKNDEALVINNRLVNKKTGQLIADFSDTGLKGPDTGVFEDADGNKIPWVWDPKAGIRRHALTGQPFPIGAGAPAQGQSAAPGQTTAPAQSGSAPASTQIGAPGTMPGQPVVTPGPLNNRLLRESKSKETGEIQAKAVAGLPGAEANVATALRQIDELIASPALKNVTGPVGGHGEWALDPDSADALSRIEQIKGKTFLSAYESLRGAQAITDIEGTKATAAKGRLDRRNVRPEVYVSALKELRVEMENDLDTARVKAGVLSPQDAEARRQDRVERFEAETKTPTAAQATALQKARAAIEAGAPREAVEQRLRQGGVNPRWLQ